MLISGFHTLVGRSLCNSVVHDLVGLKHSYSIMGKENLKCPLNHTDRELKIKPALASVYLFSCEYLS